MATYSGIWILPSLIKLKKKKKKRKNVVKVGPPLTKLSGSVHEPYGRWNIQSLTSSGSIILKYLLCFVCVDALHHSQKIFSYVEMVSVVLGCTKAEDKV